MAGFSVAICGGGIAGIEGLLRLHRLAGSEVDIALVSPAEQFVYRPMTVLEPFEAEPARRYPIARVVADTGARWERDRLSWVDRGRRLVHTDDGRQIAYDALLLAIGARELPPSPHVTVFTGRDGGQLYRRVVADLDAGRLTRVAFVLPAGTSWPLPLYELALLTARHAQEHGRAPDLSVIIPDDHPLPALGSAAGDLVTDLLADAGITLHTGARTRILSPRRLELAPDGPTLHPELIVSVPAITGPNIRGIPGYAADRFIHVDEYCRVRHTDGHIFAAGDATDQPVKHGGVGAQQADTAAAGIAHLAGVAPAPDPVRPTMDATLYTGAGPRYLSAHLIAGHGWHTALHESPPWAASDKVVAAELGEYLRGLDDSAEASNAPSRSAS
jgi:sulfide:quinone oxidoreductase